MRAPKDALKMGKYVFQYASYVKNNSEDNPITIGCITKVDDPYVSQIQTFNGTSSMDYDSVSVEGFTWDAQNTGELARVAASYKLKPESVLYKTWDESDDYRIQPCMA